MCYTKNISDQLEGYAQEVVRTMRHLIKDYEIEPKQALKACEIASRNMLTDAVWKIFLQLHDGDASMNISLDGDVSANVSLGGDIGIGGDICNVGTIGIEGAIGIEGKVEVEADNYTQVTNGNQCFVLHNEAFLNEGNGTIKVRKEDD